MKRIFNHPPAPTTGKKYWRSLEEFADTPDFRAKLEREFPQGAAELEGGEVSRRGFMQFMGASIALAGLGLTGCRRPELDIVPYSKGVEWQVPGKALHYATSMPRRGGAIPLIATTYNGRPTKLDGNSNVPGFNGSRHDLFHEEQAAVLDLYDPDRSNVLLKAKDRGKDYNEQSWDDFWKEFGALRDTLAATGGDGFAILAEPASSPTRDRLQAELQKQFPKLLWVGFDPCCGPARIATGQSHGLPGDFAATPMSSSRSIAISSVPPMARCRASLDLPPVAAVSARHRKRCRVSMPSKAVSR